MPPEAVRYCGRLFSEQEMRLIRAIIAEDPNRHRFALSQVVCERLHWRRANGQLKDMSCRVAMLRMHRDGLIQLPAPRRRHYNGTLHRRRTPQAEPELPIIARVDALPALQLRPLADQREAQLWREYVDRYHYLGYTPLPGAQMRYLVTSQRRVLAVIGFGASAWKAAPPRPLHRLERCPTRSPPAVGREQRPLLDLALGAGAQSRFHGAGPQQPPPA